MVRAASHAPRSTARSPCSPTVSRAARLNSPNDVVVKSDGTIWFTDPTYGIMSDYEGHRAEPEQPTRNVYRLDPTTGELAAVVTDFIQPNGLAFSPNETILYVADSAASHDESLPRHIRAFDVVDGRRLANGRVFCLIDNGIPDGIRTDVNGNLWSSAGDGVHCFDPDGQTDRQDPRTANRREPHLRRVQSATGCSSRQPARFIQFMSP